MTPAKTAEWQVRRTVESASGLYYVLNVVGKHDTVITVKDRGAKAVGSPERRYLCLSGKCGDLNDCEHARFVREHVEGGKVGAKVVAA